MEILKSSGFAAVPLNNLYKYLVHLCLSSTNPPRQQQQQNNNQTNKHTKKPNSDWHLDKALRLFKLLVYSQYDFHIGGWYSSASKIETKREKEISHLATGSNCQHAFLRWETSTCQQNSHFFPKRDDSLFTVQFAVWEKNTNFNHLWIQCALPKLFNCTRNYFFTSLQYSSVFLK